MSHTEPPISVQGSPAASYFAKVLVIYEYEP